MKMRLFSSFLIVAALLLTSWVGVFATVYTWTAQTASGSRDWRAITSSADGTKLAAAVESSGYIYTSTDSGVTWTEQAASGQHYWISVTSSSDGTKLAAVSFSGYIYTSTDSGATWTERTTGDNNCRQYFLGV